MSDAGSLPARWVIHAVGPVWRGGGQGEADLLASAYRTSLGLAAKLAAATVTVPAISCGIYGYPVDRAARVALEAVRDTLAAEATSIESVTFVLFSEATFEAFSDALEAMR